jgi:hypothetical protein
MLAHNVSVCLTYSSYRRVLTWTAVFCTFSDIFGGGVVGSWLRNRKVRSVGDFICGGKAERFDHIYSQNGHPLTTTSGPYSSVVCSGPTRTHRVFIMLA